MKGPPLPVKDVVLLMKSIRSRIQYRIIPGGEGVLTVRFPDDRRDRHWDDPDRLGRPEDRSASGKNRR